MEKYNMIFIQSRSFLLLLFLLSGCSTIQERADIKSEKELYKQAINDAAVIEACEIELLPVITEAQVRVVTWTNYPESFQAGQAQIVDWGALWVTLENDVKSRCLQFEQQQRVADIQKLLGLPLDTAAKRSFVTLEVDSDMLFRPCANPSIKENQCSEDFPKNVSKAHLEWYAKQTAQSYQAFPGFPWTRLGYTYNWKQGMDEVGVAEFVVKNGSKILPLSVVQTDDYCTKN